MTMTAEVCAMNRERLEQLADIMEAQSFPSDFTFDMGIWWAPKTNECGTVGCIAGLAFELWTERGADNYDDETVYDTAAYLLGLDSRQARRLFAGYKNASTTAMEAAAAIRRLLTGAAPWPPEGEPGR